MQSSSVESNVDNSIATKLTAEETALSPLIQNDHELRVPFYCEENVWRITYRKLYYPMKTNDTIVNSERYMVVFISNPSKCVPMYHQRESVSPTKPCRWDYHVILLGVTVTTNESTDNKAVYVYDVDTTLTPYPIPLTEYLTSTFSLDYVQYPKYRPFFRIIEANTFLQHFTSDRSHAFNPITKTYYEPPPSYACIAPPNSDNKTEKQVYDTNSLLFYLDFTQIESRDISIKDDVYGTIVTLEDLQKIGFS